MTARLLFAGGVAAGESLTEAGHLRQPGGQKVRLVLIFRLVESALQRDRSPGWCPDPVETKAVSPGHPHST
jgi:hypothetical protein